MAAHKVSKHNFTQFSIWFNSGKLREVIAQCFIVYESGFLEDLQKVAYFSRQPLSFMGTLPTLCVYL